MSRNRKSKEKTSQDVQGDIEISEEEQWRLINETGILKQPIPRPNAEDIKKEEEHTLAEEIFSAITLIIPFSFCLLLFEILIHFQYGKKPTVGELSGKILPNIPILSGFIFYTSRYKHTRKGQAFLFVLGCAAGCRLLWNLNKANWLVNMQQCPPFATVWVYTVVQLDLGPAVLSLLVCYGFMKWKGLTYSVRP